jgi:hypothetical protein
MRRTGGWRADIAALREVHPSLLNLERWLAATGTAQIKAPLDSDKVSSVR